MISVALLVSFVSVPLLAGEHGKHRRHGLDHGRASAVERSLQDMHTVPTRVNAQEPGFGWQYFSDPVTDQVVAISPQGDYYFSRGKGLHWAAAAQSGA